MAASGFSWGIPGGRKNALSIILSIIETGLVLCAAAMISRVVTIEMFGTYSTILSMIFVLSVLSILGVTVVVLRETSSLIAQGRDPRNLWFQADMLVVPTSLVSLVIGCGIVIFSGFEGVGLPVFFLAAIQMICVVYMGLRSHALQGFGVSNWSNFVMYSIPAMISIVVWGTCWISGKTVDLKFILLVDAIGFTLALCLMHWKRNNVMRSSSHRPRWDPEYSKLIRREGLLIAGVSAIGVFNSNVDILMLVSMAGPEAVAYYAAALKLGAFLLVVRTRLQSVVGYQITPLYENRDFRGIEQVCRPVAAICLAVASIFLASSLLWGSEILEFLYGPAFSNSSLTLVIIMAAFTFSAFFGMPGRVLIMTGHQKISFKISLIAAGLNVVLNPVAILYLGEVGAALTLAISVMMYGTIATIVLRRKFGLDITALKYFKREIHT